MAPNNLAAAVGLAGFFLGIAGYLIGHGARPGDDTVGVAEEPTTQTVPSLRGARMECAQARVRFFEECLESEKRYECEVHWAALRGRVFEFSPDMVSAMQIECGPLGLGK